MTVWIVDESVRDWLGQLRNLRVGVHWYLVGAGIMLAGDELEGVVAVVLGAEVTGLLAPPAAYVVTFAVTLLLAGALEELGWRGFLQPRLQRRFGALAASVAVGLVWIVWHLPMIAAGVGNFAVFHEYALKLVAISILLAWLYNNTAGGLPVVMVAHASHNVPTLVGVSGGVPAVFGVVSGELVFYWACALVVLLYASVQTLTSDGTLPEIPGRLTGASPRGTDSAD